MQFFSFSGYFLSLVPKYVCNKMLKSVEDVMGENPEYENVPEEHTDWRTVIQIHKWSDRKENKMSFCKFGPRSYSECSGHLFHFTLYVHFGMSDN
jgi:hypothetical protein